MKYEIKIEGLPEGWEPERFGIPKEKDTIITRDGNIISVKDMIDPPCGPRLIVRRKVRKYDWSKTLDILVKRSESFGYEMLSDCTDMYGAYIPSIWQPNIRGVCPVDPEASIVRVKYADGRAGSEVLAGTVCWSHGFGAATVIAYQFIRLADGAEW